MHISKRVVGLIALLFLYFMLPTSSATSYPLEDTVSRRQSVRDYTNENITGQQLLEVLQAAYGFMSDFRSVPRIGCYYSLIIFPVNATASYRYIPETNTIILHNTNVNKETIRPHDQNWPSDASVVLVVVWNKTKMSNPYFASAEAGCLVQNIYLSAVYFNLGTCCVGYIDSEGLRNDLQLPNDLIPLLVMPCGYPTNPYPAASPNYDFMTGNLPLVRYSDLSLEDALKSIVFVREWSPKNLSLQELSQLLWAAYGYTNVTYKTTYHRTTPSAYGIYPLVIFVSNATGVYRYLPENHSVVEVTHGDKRFDIADACAGHVWAANAPAIFLIIYNSSYNNGDTGDGGTLPHEFIEVDAGAVIQQLFLEAAAWNLSANLISEGLEDWNGTGAEQLRSILGLSPSHIPLYTVPVGAQTLDKTPPTIGTPSQNPDFTAVEPYQNVTVTVDVIDEGVGIREVTLSYTINEGQTWINTTMNNISDNTYMGKIPGFQAGTHVQYKIIAYDNANNPAVEDKNGEYYIYTVIPEFTTIMFLLILIFSSMTILIAKEKSRKTHLTNK